jgi:SAM-dependent methyltransferase
MPATYRWNTSELAAAYDADASAVHPHYREIQDELLSLAAEPLAKGGCVVDLGAGSGRLISLMLERYTNATAVLVDQSAAFLELARRKLSRFGPRFRCIHCRLQEPWGADLTEPARVIVSMSAIHHLEPSEKCGCYRQACEALSEGGVFLNGDEVRPESDAAYAAECEAWGRHMQALIANGRVSPPMADALRGWHERNVVHAAAPRTSGDDCHETAEAQLRYLREAGFSSAEAGWSRGLWTVLIGRR